MARSSDRAETRIGHDARAAATGTLDTALREGRIDLAEYERRLVVVQAAKVGTDLTSPVADLPSRQGQRGPGLRISTKERDQALIRLTEALTDGRIEAAEYVFAEERLQRAVTYADVDAVVGDLDIKASLTERDQAIERIEAAVDAGLLDPAERHGRVEAARNATTDAQLAALVADLTTNTRSPDAPVRVSNADREAVAARLYAAVEAGFLDLTEFDERVRAAYGARLSSELERLVADLPEPTSPPVLVKRVRRPVVADLPAESAPQEENSHDEELPEQFEQRTEQFEQITVQIDRLRELSEQVAKQVEQLPELLDQLPPKLAAKIARQFRLQQLSERPMRLAEQFKPISKQIRQLPDQVEQVPPEVVEHLMGQVAQLLEQYEQLAGEVEQLTEQAKP